MSLVTEEDDKINVRSNWIYFLRQMFVCSSLASSFLIYGMFIGSTTVMVPQIRKEANSTDAITMDQASWLISLPGYCGVLWGFILPYIAYRFGRKPTLIMLSVNTLLSNVIFYKSTSVTHLMISQAMNGMLDCTTNTITIMVITEYSSAKYRGAFMILKSASFYWGIWISNTVGTFFHWKNIGVVMFFFSVYNLSMILHPESPFWLATKGRYEECAKSHRWLKGRAKETEEELEKLILSQKEQCNKISKQRDAKENILMKFYKVLSSESFYKPIVYAILGTGLYYCCGKFACSAYALDITQKITGSERAAYEGMLILDGVTVLGMYIGTLLTKILKRRTQLLGFSCVGIGFLYILSVYLYLVKFNILLENKYIAISLLAGFSITISCGPMNMAACCYGELTPLKYRSTYLTIFALIASGSAGCSLKATPFLFQCFGTNGTFLFYAISSTFFIYLLYKYLPETKDKSIQEIANLIAGKKAINEIEEVPLKP